MDEMNDLDGVYDLALLISNHFESIGEGSMAASLIQDEKCMLDMGTGGGSFYLN
ncbi:hypothetical protein P9D34_04825 [Bacillus swezeyi]|uniref:hypothetical protein n=1 Tax=Bacillus swezeyi TaxID=1925020 RepID=UPI001EFBA139|nr:hypothetical protein [Bacillus swezeyi]MEC1259783.1 hypothetical protein [Bacillus swezeyi]MED2930105.1 hypothetical protein [Bacillus swezeyi]MED2944832.1 hypothetical protein [Bacillus swezeyi]MED2963006.1 hypothetical protein [Bacillus swezeyi]MED3074214.1 hypothetical protein [Bacillus swezeyi]